jgi:AraC-like DNA-binding protein
MKDASAWLDRVFPVPRPVHPVGTPHTYTSQGRTTPHWTEPLRVIYDHELVLFWDASFLLEVEGERIACAPGSFAIVPPGRWHTSYNVDGAHGRRQWCHFDWLPGTGYEDTPGMTFHPDSPVRDRLRLAPDFVPSPILHGLIRLPGRVAKVMGRLVEQQRSVSERECLLSRATLYELLVELLLPEEALVDGPAEAERLAARVRRLLDEVAARHEPIPPMVPLLETLGRSYAHLCRLFRQEYGISPLRYVHAARMGRARLLLAEGRFGIAEIAYRLGYDDPGHFTRVFRKITGTTPTEFQSANSGGAGG